MRGWLVLSHLLHTGIGQGLSADGEFTKQPAGFLIAKVKIMPASGLVFRLDSDISR